MKIILWIATFINEVVKEDDCEVDVFDPKVFVSECEAREYLVNIIKDKIKDQYDGLIEFNQEELYKIYSDEVFLEIMEVGKRLLKNKNEFTDFNFKITQQELDCSGIIFT